MNPSGLWRGMTEADGRIGHFKFINVEMIPQTTRERKRSDRRKRSNASNKGSHCPNNENSKLPGYQDPNKSIVDSRDETQGDEASSNIKESSNLMNSANDDVQNNSLALRIPTNDESNLNSRPKSVEDLLRRIGLEVRKWRYFKIILSLLQ